MEAYHTKLDFLMINATAQKNTEKFAFNPSRAQVVEKKAAALFLFSDSLYPWGFFLLCFFLHLASLNRFLLDVHRRTKVGKAEKKLSNGSSSAFRYFFASRAPTHTHRGLYCAAASDWLTNACGAASKSAASKTNPILLFSRILILKYSSSSW